VMPVRYRIPSGEWTTAQTRDIGVGGAFIAAPDVLAKGTPTTVEITLPTSDQVFALSAIVRWSSPQAGGMGLQFVDVDAAVLLELTDFFATL
jgi:hypothetical protein